MPAPLAVTALRFRALGDETRLALLSLLSAGERTVADLIEATGLGQSLVSHHLRTLRDAGLVTTRRDGRWIYYAIGAQAVASVKLALYELA
ncbi:MAG: metalloregulator ArsR/SmtB family transcription factor [bacterium]